MDPVKGPTPQATPQLKAMKSARNSRLINPSAAAICIACLGLPGLLEAQGWSGILNPERAADWSKAGIPEGIPNRTTICKTLSEALAPGKVQAP